MPLIVFFVNILFFDGYNWGKSIGHRAKFLE